MKTASVIGSMVVIVALVFYSVGYFKEKRHKLVTSGILLFYSIGLTLDITATTLMIIGSSRGIINIAWINWIFFLAWDAGRHIPALEA